MDGANVVSSQEIEKGKCAAPPDYSKEDEYGKYELLDWFEDTTCTTPYLFGPVYNSHNVYSKWIECVTFDANTYGRFTDTQEQKKTISVNLDKTVRFPDESLLQKDESIFLGWYTDVNSGISWNKSLKIEKPMTLYAHWKFKTYIVSFQDDQGNKISSDQEIESGRKVDFTKVDPHTPDNYVFDDWYIKDTEIAWNNRKVDKDVILVPRYKEIEYTVEFNMGKYGSTVINNNEVKSIIKSQTVSQGGFIKCPNQPEYIKEPNPGKYVFTNWYTDPDYDDGSIWDFEHRKVKKSDATNAKKDTITLYAGWRINTFSVSFDACSTRVSNPNKLENVIYGRTIDEPDVATLNDEMIEKWYEKVDYSGEPFIFGEGGTGVKKNLTLYAKWVSAKNVSFDTDGGDSISPIQVASGNVINAFDGIIPHRTGYSFTGWYNGNVKWKASEPLRHSGR